MTRRKALALLLWGVLMLACVGQILRTPFVADLSAFLPASPDAQQRVLIEQLQSGLPARTLLLAVEGGSAAQRAEGSRALAARLRASGLFEQVQNGQTDGMAGIGEFIFHHRYQLSPAVEPARFTADGLRAGITESLSLLGTPAGGAIKPILERDPTGETLRVGESLIPAGAPRSVEGVWASRNSTPGSTPERALLLTISRAPGADLDAQQAGIERIRSEFAALATPGQPAAGLTLRLSGAPLFGVDSRAQIEREVKWLSLSGTVMMCVLLLLAFGSLRALAAAALPVVTGVLAGVAAVGLVFGQVHAMTLGFGTTLIGEAVDYGIYYLIQARAAGAAAWLRHGWPTVRLGLLTSVIGFAALVFSGFPGLQQLGVFSVAGLLGAAAFTRWVMPELLPQGAAGQGLRVRLGAFMQRALALLPRLKWPLLAVGALAAVFLALQPRLWQAELSALSPVSQEALDLDASLRADLSAGDARTLVAVSGPDLEATLALAEAAGASLDRLVDEGAIGGYDSVARFLPSLALQRQRQAALPEAAALQAALAEATAGGPLTATRLAPFVAEVQAARALPPVSLQALRDAGLATLVDALLLQRPDGSWVSLLPLQPGPDGAAPPLGRVQQALSTVPGAQVLEIGPALTRLYARYLAQAQEQALLGALAVVLLMAATLRSVPRLLAVCQPLVLAVLITLGGLVALGVQPGILHLVGLLLVAAVGSNYALFFDLLAQDRAAGRVPDPDTLASLLLANLTTVAAFGLIAFSSIPALAAIGRVVGPGALLALVLAAAFAPRAPGAAREAAARGL